MVSSASVAGPSVQMSFVLRDIGEMHSSLSAESGSVEGGCFAFSEIRIRDASPAGYAENREAASIHPEDNERRTRS